MKNWSTAKKIWIWGGLGAASLVTLGLIIWKRTPYERSVVKIANDEWAIFGFQTIDKSGNLIKGGARENEEGYWQRVGDYWRAVGSSLTGKDRGTPWSSAFIGYVMSRAGNKFNIDFTTSSAHNTYIREYISNRKQGRENADFVGYRIDEISPKVGDLVCYGRNGEGGYDSTSRYKSHCDIVVKKKRGEIEVIGGNVKDGVTKKILATNKNGRVIDTNNEWFTVIKNNT
jgi:hypothetical protein